MRLGEFVLGLDQSSIALRTSAFFGGQGKTSAKISIGRLRASQIKYGIDGEAEI